MVITRKKMFCMHILLVILILTGCFNKNQDIGNIEETPTKTQSPVAGGTIQLPIIQFDTLNPVLNDNKSVYYLNNLIYEGLVRLEANLDVQSALATNWTVSEDGMEWTFLLREDIQWHDGKLFSAEDVKFTIDTLKYGIANNQESIFKPYVQHITNVTVLGSDQIMIKLDHPLNSSIELFVFPIIPKHAFKSIADVYKASEMIPVGTGMYKVSKVDKLKTVILEPNDHYWGNKPYITSVMAKVVPDKDAALTSLEANEVSMASAGNLDWEKYSEDKSLKIYEYVTNDYEFLGFNFNRAITGDKNIREAIAYAIDRHAIVDEVYLGHATVTDVPIDPDSWLYEEEEKKFGIDTMAAKKLLNQSNYEDKDGDGIVEGESGHPLKLSLVVNGDNELRLRVADLIASQLKEVGIAIDIIKLSWDDYTNRVYTNNFDIALGGWQLLNPMDLRFFIDSSFIGTSNFIGYSNVAMDALLMEASTTDSKELKKQKYREIQHLFTEDLPYFSLYFKNDALIAKKYVKGIINPKEFNIYTDFDQWYITEE